MKLDAVTHQIHEVQILDPGVIKSYSLKKTHQKLIKKHKKVYMTHNLNVPNRKRKYAYIIHSKVTNIKMNKLKVKTRNR